jgi:DNA-binding transcriptional MerR regulator
LAFLKDSSPVSLVNQASEHYLIIGNSHDQSSKIFLGLSNYMFRCENQFSRELYHLRIKHTQRLDMSDEDIYDVLKKYEQGKREQMSISNELSNRSIGKDEVHVFLQFMFPDPQVKEQMSIQENESLRRSRNRRREMMESIQLEMKDLGQNAWGLLNGVTYYTSHRIRGNSGFGNTNGTAQQLNARAWEYCQGLLIERK